MPSAKRDVAGDRQNADLWSVINDSKTYQQFLIKWSQATSAAQSRLAHQSNHSMTTSSLTPEMLHRVPRIVVRDLAMSTEEQRKPLPWSDAQGIALLLTATTLAFVLGTGVLWIGLR